VDANVRAHSLRHHWLCSRAFKPSLSNILTTPVRDYLDPLIHDGKPRLDDLLIRYYGAGRQSAP